MIRGWAGTVTDLQRPVRHSGGGGGGPPLRHSSPTSILGVLAVAAFILFPSAA